MTTQRLSYSVGFTLPDHTPDLLARIPAEVWTEAYDAHDEVRDGAWVAELTDLLDLSSWPAGMRLTRDPTQTRSASESSRHGHFSCPRHELTATPP